MYFLYHAPHFLFILSYFLSRSPYFIFIHPYFLFPLLFLPPHLICPFFLFSSTFFLHTSSVLHLSSSCTLSCCFEAHENAPQETPVDLLWTRLISNFISVLLFFIFTQGESIHCYLWTSPCLWDLSSSAWLLAGQRCVKTNGGPRITVWENCSWLSLSRAYECTSLR